MPLGGQPKLLLKLLFAGVAVAQMSMHAGLQVLPTHHAPPTVHDALVVPKCEHPFAVLQLSLVHSLPSLQTFGMLQLKMHALHEP